MANLVQNLLPNRPVRDSFLTLYSGAMSSSAYTVAWACGDYTSRYLCWSLAVSGTIDISLSVELSPDGNSWFPPKKDTDEADNVVWSKTGASGTLTGCIDISKYAAPFLRIYVTLSGDGLGSNTRIYGWGL